MEFLVEIKSRNEDESENIAKRENDIDCEQAAFHTKLLHSINIPNTAVHKTKPKNEKYNSTFWNIGSRLLKNYLLTCTPV